MTYAYIRVSTVEQKIERQLDSLQDYQVDRIFIDKQSGKNFDRAAYKEMKETIQKGDLLILHSVDRLGRDYEKLIKEWKEITQEIGCDIEVLNMPFLNTRERGKDDVTGLLISDIVLQVLSFVAQNERDTMLSRQREGIEAAKLRGTYNPGRPSLEVDDRFIRCYQAVCDGEMPVTQAVKELGISRSSWYNMVKKMTA